MFRKIVGTFDLKKLLLTFRNVGHGWVGSKLFLRIVFENKSLNLLFVF